MKRTFIWLGALALIWYLCRKPLLDLYHARVAGLEAAQDAHTMTGYTTYNTTLYAAPFWQPLLNFFRANAYVPSGVGQKVNTVDYSMQG